MDELFDGWQHPESDEEELGSTSAVHNDAAVALARSGARVAGRTSIDASRAVSSQARGR